VFAPSQSALIIVAKVIAIKAQGMHYCVPLFFLYCAPMSEIAKLRIRVFVDFWNFQISANHIKDRRIDIDWKKLGPWLSKEASGLLDVEEEQVVSFDGMHVYASYDPRKPTDRSLKNWACNTLDRFPGVNVLMKERKKKSAPCCPICHVEVSNCPHCGGTMIGSVEKGIDTAIVTDMIKLAWEDAYDVAVLVSGDRDFIPAVEFLSDKGVRVIQAGFPPLGSNLACKCWASINIAKGIENITR